MVTHTLVVRLDSAGDVLLAGPAVRAVTAGSDRVTMLAGPPGAAAAGLLPGVHEVLEWHCPWIAAEPEPVRAADIAGVVGSLAGRGIDGALVLTSFHQSPLPTALVLRLAGVPWIGAISEDYPGSLLDLRHQVDPMLPEAERALSLARAAGYDLPAGDRGRLAVRQPLPDVPAAIAACRPVVLHPGTAVPARAWPLVRHREAAARLSARGHDVVVTGSPAEAGLTAQVCEGTGALDLGGRTSLAELAAVLARAAVVVVANTGPAHLAAAVGTPVVSLFAPTVPATRWAPYGVPSTLLGDQDAPCKATRATTCPVPGHPCLTSVTAEEVVAAVEDLIGRTTAPQASSARTIADAEEVRA
jgi:ADP-heptose:LPS heptosyltransferase